MLKMFRNLFDAAFSLSPLGALPYTNDGGARRNFEKNPQKVPELLVGVDQINFHP